MQRKKFVINKLILVGVPFILALIALSAITVSVVMFGMKYSFVDSFPTISTTASLKSVGTPASLTSVGTTLVNINVTALNTTKSTTVFPVANYAY